MYIRKYFDFINEAKLYLYHTTFKVYDLFDAGIYKNNQIKKWMAMYDFDQYAHCVIVSKTRPTSLKRYIGLPQADLRIRNVNYFDSDIKKHQGYMPEDSKKILEDGSEVYLYVFKKNSNEANRARQLHGFIYEGDVRRYNGLKRFGKTYKWDAEGGMDKTYLSWRLESGKKIELWDTKSNTYQSLLKKDPVSGVEEVMWTPGEGDPKFDYYPETFSEFRNWSIKCMKIGTDVEMGDFKRIAGLEMVNGKLTIKDTDAEHFILAVGFHDGVDKKNIVEEYLILMPVAVWETYLPDVWNKTQQFEQMYKDLLSHRLKGKETEEQEKAWLEFRLQYKKLAESSTIKLRFKRDSKGQLRIQSAISFRDFKTKILSNPHIKIY